MTVSSVGKATFYQMLPSFEILFSRPGVSDLATSIQQLLISMPVDSAPLTERVQKARNSQSRQVPLAVTYSQLKRLGRNRRARMVSLAGQR